MFGNAGGFDELFVTDPTAPVDIAPAIREVARNLRAFYQALIETGFEQDQALMLVADFFRTVVTTTAACGEEDNGDE